MEILKVKENTYCIDVGITYIPFYKINDEEIIILDIGLKRGERGVFKKFLKKFLRLQLF